MVILESLIIYILKNKVFEELLLVYAFVGAFDILSFITLFKYDTLLNFIVCYLKRLMI